MTLGKFGEQVPYIPRQTGVLRNIGDTGMIDLIKYDFDDVNSTAVDLGPSDTKPKNS